MATIVRRIGKDGQLSYPVCAQWRAYPAGAERHAAPLD